MYLYIYAYVCSMRPFQESQFLIPNRKTKGFALSVKNVCERIRKE